MATASAVVTILYIVGCLFMAAVFVASSRFWRTRRLLIPAKQFGHFFYIAVSSVFFNLAYVLTHALLDPERTIDLFYPPALAVGLALSGFASLVGFRLALIDAMQKPGLALLQWIGGCAFVGLVGMLMVHDRLADVPLNQVLILSLVATNLFIEPTGTVAPNQTRSTYLGGVEVQWMLAFGLAIVIIAPDIPMGLRILSLAAIVGTGVYCRLRY